MCFNYKLENITVTSPSKLFTLIKVVHDKGKHLSNLRSFLQTSGPPESPSQASTPPSKLPAQNIPAVMFLPYTSGWVQVTSDSSGTLAARSSRE